MRLPLLHPPMQRARATDFGAAGVSPLNDAAAIYGRCFYRRSGFPPVPDSVCTTREVCYRNYGPLVLGWSEGGC